MSPASITYRRFVKLVRDDNCRVVRKGSHGHVEDGNGDFVSAFAVTHGKNTKGEEVKPIYVKLFLKARGLQ